jgi:aminomethyltransferase
LERQRVPGGGSRAVAIEAGDEISVVDREGLQPCELVFFAPDGHADPARIGARPAGAPDGLRTILSSGEASARRVRTALERAGFDLGAAKCARVFGDGSRAGDSATFHAGSDGLLIVAAPGGPMAVDAQTPPTEIVLYIRRAAPQASDAWRQPPAPLADPLTDVNILPGNAKTYEVRKGQYIQVLDVQGRECSDFQALDMRAVEAGQIADIDPTTTRSLMGALYPGPGIYSKYFSVDMQPLVEIVQDTCGRHDTFGLACTARYYEDLGYPGHVNCTDNINREMAQYGLRPRGGWPAINFFFNTMLDDANAIGMDDPWSRPGDYVLLRALTDLVCVSTACPCDVDPANGWNPTDIQVRVYGENEDFQRSIGFRMTVDADMQHTKKTAFHDRLARHTRNFVEYNGYWLPNDFPAHGAIEEYWACREKAAVMDLSPLRKFEVTGPDAETLLQLCLTRNMKKLSVGQVMYSAVCYEHGGMADDGTVFRLGENNFRWVGGSDVSGLWMREQAQKRGLDVWVRSSTDQLHNIAVQGPKSRDILRELIWTPPDRPTLDELGVFRFTVGRIGDFHGQSVVVSRTGYTGELGFEVFCHPKDAHAVFDAIWDAGQPHGLTPFGLEALNMVRIEAGLIFAGFEFCDQTDPFEAGIGFTVPLKSKEDDFIGRAALEERKAHPRRKMVGLDLAGQIVPSTGDCVRIGRAQVGEITSAIRSPILGKVIALCRMDVTHAVEGTEVEVGQLDGFQKRIPATVVKAPHFDPTKERVKGNYS